MSTKAYIFDVFGTLVDWRNSVARECSAVFTAKGITTDPHVFATDWRAEYDPAMARIREGGRGYVPLEKLHLENLAITFKKHKISENLSQTEMDDLNTAWEKLDPWGDVVAGLIALKAHGSIAPCSNGSVAMMTRLAGYGGLPWDDYVGAERAQDYKPKLDVYLKSAAWLGLEPSEVMMVAAHNSDLVAAREAGLKTGFFARPSEHGPGQTKDLVAEQDWDLVADDLVDLARRVSG